jgi:hypothetical protein
MPASIRHSHAIPRPSPRHPRSHSWLSVRTRRFAKAAECSSNCQGNAGNLGPGNLRLGPLFLEWEWFYGSTILSNFFFTLQDVPCNHVAMSSLYICFIVPNVGTTATRTVNIDILLLYTHDRIYIYIM